MTPKTTKGDRIGGERTRSAHRIDDVLAALARARRRELVFYLREHDGVSTVEDLCQHVASTFDTDERTVASQLHHADLQKLTSSDVIVYDEDDERVWYRGGSLVTELVDTLARHE